MELLLLRPISPARKAGRSDCVSSPFGLSTGDGKLRILGGRRKMFIIAPASQSYGNFRQLGYLVFERSLPPVFGLDRAPRGAATLTVTAVPTPNWSGLGGL